jgi:Rrf2 family protein
MALMSRKVDYALLILSHLHGKPEGACARELADHYGLSRSFVANILKDICHQGLVTSHRGVKGGYVLARPADKISVAELIDGLDDPFNLAESTPSGTPGRTVTAVVPLRGPIAVVHERIRDLLRGLTLAQVFRDNPNPAPYAARLATGVAAAPLPAPVPMPEPDAPEDEKTLHDEF